MDHFIFFLAGGGGGRGGLQLPEKIPAQQKKRKNHAQWAKEENIEWAFLLVGSC